jgi:thiol-disulfide isomerase/thioredoxin
VAVQGAALADFTQAVRDGTAPDTALCEPAPVVAGYDYDGNAVTIDPASDGPTMVVLLAHWCPHCNNEIPVLNEWRDSGEIPDGLNIVGVSTGVSSDAPNYPPDEWLVEKDWQWPVLVDDSPPDDESPAPAMGAYGGTSYPTMVLIDGDGLVRQRLSGEVPTEVLAPLVDDLVA